MAGLNHLVGEVWCLGCRHFVRPWGPWEPRMAPRPYSIEF